MYLVRHGETEWSATGRHTSRTDVPLTAVGETQAKAVGEFLARCRGMDAGPAIVWSSPRERAVRTAALAGLTVDSTREELSEWDYGDLEGLTTDEIRESDPGWTVWTHACPGGESAEAVTRRVNTVLAGVEEALTHGDVIVVGHGHLHRALTARWIGSPVSAGVHLALDPGCVTILGDEHGVPGVLRANLPPGW